MSSGDRVAAASGGGAGRAVPARRPTPPAELLRLMAWSVFGGLAAGAAAVEVMRIQFSTVALLAAGVVGIASGLLAACRFEWFILGIFATRSMLDLLDQEGTRGGFIDPAAALGVMFIAIGGLWLFVQWRSGLWVRPSRLTVALFLVASAAFLSVPASADRFVSLEATLKVLSGALMFAVVEQLLAQRPRRARALLVAAFASLAVPAAVGLLQVTGGSLSADLNTGVARVHGTFVHPNVLATYVVMLVLVAAALVPQVRGWARLGVLAVLAAGVPLLLLSYARAAWLGAIVGLVYLGVRWSRRLLGVLLAGVVVVVLVVPSVLTRLSDLGGEREFEHVPANSLAWRIGYWGDLLPLADSSPVVGIGLDMAQWSTEEGLRPHNVFVQTYVETGLVGVAALGWLLIAASQTLRERVRQAETSWEQALALAAMAVALSLLVQFVSENLTTSTVLWWYAAAAMTHGLGRSLFVPAASSTVAQPARAERVLAGAGAGA